MRVSEATVTAPDGTQLHTYRWLPDHEHEVVGVVQIVHGMAEHAGRYARLAGRLTDAGYVVYAHDQRGHGRTAATADDLGHFADKGGWDLVVEDVAGVTGLACLEYPKEPIALLGHSMGSLVARAYAIKHSHDIDALVLTGTAADPGMMRAAGAAVAAAERAVRGARARSPLLTNLTFGAYNKAFAPNRTTFDWLSRDEAEVDAYIADPLCGAIHTTAFFGDLLHGLGVVNTPSEIDKVRPTLPVYVMSGGLDATGSNGAGPLATAEQYRHAGLRDVNVRLYPGARHEIFNETNRDEVTDDLIAWLRLHLRHS